MIFASNLFLLYFLPIFAAAYALAPQRLRNALALVASLLFYAWGAPRFVFVVLAVGLLDYLVALRIGRRDRHAGTWLAVAVVYNLGLLVYFKYANFFVGNTNSLLTALGASPMPWTEVALPLGISFLTFQQLSYLIDVRRGERPPLRNPLDYLLLVGMFPHLVAGPLLRYREMADQLHDRRAHETIPDRLQGLIRFAIGLGRKVLIADTIGMQVNKIFALPHEALDTPLAWLGAVGFAFVVYHDFAGYSDMAIGLARMMGFRFPENFNVPFAATSLSEFWRRWHMTLSGWFKAYVYLPLRRTSRWPWMLHVNLWIVFLLTGLWHGAAWTFVLFGVWHGLWLTLERLFLGDLLKRLPQGLAVAWTFFLFVLGCVFFKAPDLGTAWAFFRSMFSFQAHPAAWETLGLATGTKFWSMLGLAATISLLALLPRIRALQERPWELPTKDWKVVAWTLVAVVLLVLSVSEIGTMGFRPFIYYMF